MKAEFKTTCSRLVIAVCFAACLAAHGQALPGTAKDDGRAAVADMPAFEVATIKPVGPDSRLLGFYSKPGGKVFIGYTAVKTLVQYAFNVQSFQVSTNVSWADSDKYDIVALPPESSPSRTASQPPIVATPTEEQRKMLQSLLIQRFNLKFHRETREGSISFLERSGKTLRLKPPEHPDGDPRGNILASSLRDGVVFGQNLSMPFLASMISRELGQPVLDRTGITGNYDFHLDPIDSANTDQNAAVIEAMSQLGLKLKSGKGPVETIVIDSVSRPSEN